MQLPQFKVSLPALLTRWMGRCRSTYDYAKHKFPFHRRTRTKSGSTESEADAEGMSQSVPRRRSERNPNSQFWTVNEERDLQEMLATFARQQEEEKARNEVNEDIGENSQVGEDQTRVRGEMKRNGRPNSLYWEFEQRPHSHHIRSETQLGTRPARWSSGPFLPDNGKFVEAEWMVFSFEVRKGLNSEGHGTGSSTCTISLLSPTSRPWMRGRPAQRYHRLQIGRSLSRKCNSWNQISFRSVVQYDTSELTTSWTSHSSTFFASMVHWNW